MRLKLTIPRAKTVSVVKRVSANHGNERKSYQEYHENNLSNGQPKLGFYEIVTKGIHKCQK